MSYQPEPQFPPASCKRPVGDAGLLCTRPFGHTGDCRHDQDMVIRPAPPQGGTGTVSAHRGDYKGPFGMVDPREHAIAIDDLSGQIERLKAIADALREEIRARDVAIAKLRAERPIMCSPVERWEER